MYLPKLTTLDGEFVGPVEVPRMLFRLKDFEIRHVEMSRCVSAGIVLGIF